MRDGRTDRRTDGVKPIMIKMINGDDMMMMMMMMMITVVMI